MVTRGPTPIRVDDDAKIEVRLTTAERWVGAVVVCFVAILSSAATCAVTYGRMTQRLDAVERRQEQGQTDHDTLTRLDERVAWLCEKFGKKD